MGVKVGDICDTRVLSKCRMGQVKLSFLRIEGKVGEKKRLFAAPCKGVALLPRASAHAYSLHIWAKMTKIVV